MVTCALRRRHDREKLGLNVAHVRFGLSLLPRASMGEGQGGSVDEERSAESLLYTSSVQLFS